MDSIIEIFQWVALSPWEEKAAAVGAVSSMVLVSWLLYRIGIRYELSVGYGCLVAPLIAIGTFFAVFVWLMMTLDFSGTT